MKRLNYESLFEGNAELLKELQQCKTKMPLAANINYNLFVMMQLHIMTHYSNRREFLETAIINQLKKEGVIK